MDEIRVMLFSERGLDRRYADETAGWFHRFVGPIKCLVINRSVEIKDGPKGLLCIEDVFAHLAKLRVDSAISPTDIVFLLTRSPNEGNLFCAADGDSRAGVGHVDDFRWVTTAPLSVILTRYVFEAVFATLLANAGIDDNGDLCHEDSRGCLFDYCGRKWELNLSLRTADICGDCMEVLRSVPVSDALLRQIVEIMEASRRLALNTGQYLTADTPFQRWPFPVAITRHKATQATDPLLRFLALLDHFDSLVRYFFLVRETQLQRRPVLVDRPSLGWWVDQLAASLKGEKHFRDIVSIAQQEKVVQLRNEKRGHGWVAAKSEHYVPDVERLEGILQRIEEELEPFFVSHQLLIPRQIELREEGYLVEGENLTGSNLLHPLFRITLDGDPRSHGISSQDRVFVADRGFREFHVISPYIRSEICPACNHPRVLITDGGDLYIDAFMGHRVSLRDGVPSVAQPTP